MPNLRLYQITDTYTRRRANDQFFSDKKAAKLARRELNGEENGPLRYVVSPGPDHHNYDAKTGG